MHREKIKKNHLYFLKEENNEVLLKIEEDGVGLGFDFNTTKVDTINLHLVS